MTLEDKVDPRGGVEVGKAHFLGVGREECGDEDAEVDRSLPEFNPEGIMVCVGHSLPREGCWV